MLTRPQPVQLYVNQRLLYHYVYPLGSSCRALRIFNCQWPLHSVVQHRAYFVVLLSKCRMTRGSSGSQFKISVVIDEWPETGSFFIHNHMLCPEPVLTVQWCHMLFQYYQTCPMLLVGFLLPQCIGLV